MPHSSPTPNRSARHPAAAAQCDARSRASRRAGRSSGRTWPSGLVDDLVLGAAYARVAECSADAALHAAVDRIVDVKRRHTRFFDEEVRRRLPTSGRTARLARRELRRTTWPLGSAALAVGERTAFARFTFGGADGIALAADLERAIAALPGIDARTAAIVLRGLAGRRAA